MSVGACVCVCVSVYVCMYAHVSGHRIQKVLFMFVRIHRRGYSRDTPPLACVCVFMCVRVCEYILCVFVCGEKKCTSTYDHVHVPCVLSGM